MSNKVALVVFMGFVGEKWGVNERRKPGKEAWGGDGGKTGWGKS